MEKWNFDELRELCQKNGIQDPSIYTNSIDLRYSRALFHKEKADKILNDLFSQSFSTADDRFYEAWESFETHVECFVYALHSMADILAQILNIVLLRGKFAEDQVSLKRLQNEMDRQGIAPDVSNKIKDLFDSTEFCYIEAFCNTKKHRRVIDSQFRAEFGGHYRNEEGMVFDEIDYKGHLYPRTWGTDIIGPYREKIFELLTEIGKKINDFLR